MAVAYLAWDNAKDRLEVGQISQPELLKLEADYKVLENYTVKGSKDCERIQELIAINKRMEVKLKALDTKFAGYDPNNIPDSVAKAVRKEYSEIIKEQEDGIEKFVTDNKSITIYFAALFMMQSPPMALLQKIDKKGFKTYSKGFVLIRWGNF